MNAKKTRQPEAKKQPVCPHCGSADVRASTYVEWSVEDQDWVLTDIGIGEVQGDGECLCDSCEESDFDPIWKEIAA